MEYIPCNCTYRTESFGVAVNPAEWIGTLHSIRMIALTPKDGIVLSLRDCSGIMVKPWAEAGFSCWIVDLKHPAPDTASRVGRGAIRRVHADVRDWLPPRTKIAIVFAFPPCQHLAVSGSGWFRKKGLAKLIEGLSVVEACRRIAEWSDAPYMIENPVSTLSTYWRKPDYYFDPCEYAGHSDASEAYTKRTCLWVGNGFEMPPRNGLSPVLGSKMHRLPPSGDRAAIRSQTPRGFACGVFLQHAQAA